MNTTQRIAKTAKALGYTVTTEFGGQMVARNAEGQARISAGFVAGRFVGGYVLDSLGHVVPCATVRDLIRFAA